jgi:predicted chitinase
MAVKFDINKAINNFKEKGGKTQFPDSLKQVLIFIQDDDNFKTKNEIAWLLATAKVESDYSLQRWESDYLCGKAGVPYDKQPCQRAINYYRSTNGKKNYFDLGTDKNGMAYFGRGLIQLTGKSNYDKYGKLIGVDLVEDGGKAMIPKNSYRIASEYFNRKRGSAKKSVNDYANEGDFAMARKRVKGSSKGWEDAKREYDRWLSVFNEKETKFKADKMSRKKRRAITIPLLVIAVVGISIGVVYALKKRNK